MPFTSCGGCLRDIFITEAEIIDRYVGNQLWTWGAAGSGQLGTNSIVDRSSPVQTVSGGTNWQQVNSNDLFTGAIKTDGTLWLWGLNTNGQLGRNNVISASSPVQTVSATTNWKQVSVGQSHVGAIKTDGTLWMWGLNSDGHLGDRTTISRSSPVQTISGGTNWKQVAVALCFSAAIKTDGTLWLWGGSTGGILGDNSASGFNKSSPVQTVSGGTNWKEVSFGCRHVGAIKTDGTLWMWGTGTSGALGNNSVLNQSSPVQTVSAGTNWKYVNPGTNYTMAIKTDGTLWAWGDGSCGILGTNNLIARSSPVQTVSGGTNWKQVFSAKSQTFAHTAAIKTDGTLWLWGLGGNGKLGNNSGLAVSSPVQTISGGTYWKQVTVGSCHTAAVTYTEA